MKNDFLARVIADLKEKYQCHTFILYGSQARGDATENSDWDILAIRPVGEMFRDARIVEGQYLDTWIYSEEKISCPDENFLHIRGGRVIEQKNRLGDEFIAKLEAIYKAGPKPSADWDIELRQSWIQKMIDRSQQEGIEANYRRHWLLYQLLDDYFYFQNKWPMGPKLGFRWMKENDLFSYQLFERALQPSASFSDVNLLAQHVKAKSTTCKKQTPQSDEIANKPQFLIQSERSFLRLGTEADVPEILKYYIKNKDHFASTDPPKPPGFYTENFWHGKIKKAQEEYQSQKSFRFFMFSKVNQSEVIGVVNLTQIVQSPFYACYLGYGISREYEGKGMMFEILKPTIQYAFEKIKMHRIMANHLTHNQRSARLLKRLGFEVEGVAKKYLLINGEWRDHVLNSLIYHDWNYA